MQSLERHFVRNVVNGRFLGAYEKVLGFSRAELAGKRVLNFGCGGSNIGKELRAAGIACDVVDADVLPNPHSVHDEEFTFEEQLFRKRVMERKILEDVDGQILLPLIEEQENIRLGIDGREFHMLSCEPKLPFMDDVFDYVLVSWVFHQIPDHLQREYIEEFVRVGKRVYIAPVGRKELHDLEDYLATLPADVESLTYYESEGRKEFASPPKIETSERVKLVNGVYRVRDLEIDYSEKPYSVNCAGTARVVLKKKP